jgi:hypothetical protein
MPWSAGFTRRNATHREQTPATGLTSIGAPHLLSTTRLVAHATEPPTPTTHPHQRPKPKLSASRYPIEKRKTVKRRTS